MAIRGVRGMPKTSSSSSSPAHRLFVPMMLLLVFITTGALLYKGSGPALHPAGVSRSSHLGSTHLQAYVARISRALKSDPLKAKEDYLFKLATDQVALLNAHALYARKGKLDMSKQLKTFTDLLGNFTELLNRPEIKALQDRSMANEDVLRLFEKELKERIKVTRQSLSDAKELYDNHAKIQKLKDTIFAVNDQLTKAKKHTAFSSFIAAKSVPKSLHCLSMRLMEEYISNPGKYAENVLSTSAFEDPSLYHYVIFSQNALAASVVVNSVSKHAKKPEKHVFHIVSDKMNVWAMRVWFNMRAPNGSHIEVKAIEDYKFVNSSYVPVLRQIKSFAGQWFDSQMENETKDPSTSIKSQNPKFLAMLKHLRFYLAEMYPKLHKILFLEDDVVVQKDLTGLWSIDMDGKVNAAVETCFGPFHRYDKYLNFSNPIIKKKFDPNACAWAFGVNMFDLDAWRRERCTEEYHYWQNLNENGALWKSGTLAPGLVAFYKMTKPLDKSWHVLGLGYNPNVSIEKIKKASVIHYNGNMKPWLDLAMNQYSDYWTKYVDHGMIFVQMCNFGH